jgi:nucleoside-diphosphate-sugar epimerase
LTDRYLVTGGAGFIGSNIAETLLSQGAFVRVLDNLATGKEENLEVLRRTGGDLEIVRGDLRSLDEVRRAVAGVDYVIHQGALPSVPKSVAMPLETNETNVTGTLNVLVAARDAKVRRVVYASSSSVYGDTPTLPKHEEMAPAPLSPYALQKLAGEFYCRQFHSLYGLETVSLRYFNVFGKRQDPASEYAAVIPKFVDCFHRGVPPTIYGDGEQTRDFTFIDNVVSANLLGCTAPGAGGLFCNVATGYRLSLNGLAGHLRKIFGRDIRPNYAPTREGDVKHSLADISRAREGLGFEILVDFETGLRRYVEWYVANNPL